MAAKYLKLSPECGGGGVLTWRVAGSMRLRPPCHTTTPTPAPALDKQRYSKLHDIALGTSDKHSVTEVALAVAIVCSLVTRVPGGRYGLGLPVSASGYTGPTYQILSRPECLPSSSISIGRRVIECQNIITET
ncbi:hypothetical protein J6590_023831 [Homalodisca vitripennis]|nr:hypothetical protein J6590_023831 [Homalodisca vitripennis]